MKTKDATETELDIDGPDPELLTALGCCNRALTEIVNTLTRQARGEIPSMLQVSRARARASLQDALGFLDKALRRGEKKL